MKHFTNTKQVNKHNMHYHKTTPGSRSHGITRETCLGIESDRGKRKKSEVTYIIKFIQRQKCETKGIDL